MIQTEHMEINGEHFIRTWSDENRYVVRDGIKYEEAIDPEETDRAYTESDEKIPEYELRFPEMEEEAGGHPET